MESEPSITYRTAMSHFPNPSILGRGDTSWPVDDRPVSISSSHATIGTAPDSSPRECLIRLAFRVVDNIYAETRYRPLNQIHMQPLAFKSGCETISPGTTRTTLEDIRPIAVQASPTVSVPPQARDPISARTQTLRRNPGHATQSELYRSITNTLSQVTSDIQTDRRHSDVSSVDPPWSE